MSTKSRYTPQKAIKKATRSSDRLRQKIKPYWIGPYEIYVDINIKQITAADGENYLDQDGSQTEKLVQFPMSKADYLKKFTRVRKDGLRWWIEK